MAIEIQRKGDKFIGRVLGVDGTSVIWQSTEPVLASLLSSELRKLGYDQREVMKAFIRSDPDYFDLVSRK